MILILVSVLGITVGDSTSNTSSSTSKRVLVVSNSKSSEVVLIEAT